jgi:hypothetical protein
MTFTPESAAEFAQKHGAGTCIIKTRGEDFPIYTLFSEELAAALNAVAEQALAQRGEPVACRGQADRDCGYLAVCGAICNKCGSVHRGIFTAAPDHTALLRRALQSLEAATTEEGLEYHELRRLREVVTAIRAALGEKE